MTTIYIGAVKLDESVNLYAGRTRASVENQIANWCREWWNDVLGEDMPPIPTKSNEIVSLYFEAMRDEGVESYIIEEIELI